MCVVKLDTKKYLQEIVGQPVDGKFDLRIIDHSAAMYKAAAKHTVVTFIKFFPVTHDVATVVRFVGHHNDSGFTRHVIEPADNRAAESVGREVLDRS